MYVSRPRAAMVGLRPVVEVMTLSFTLQAFDQIVNTAAKLCYVSEAGQAAGAAARP